ncbi:MAG: tetratricopeptide repeat protein [Synergistaceae bacterium]|nr:tetratricopeptide repeat protein [Synergistaceae bacterium]
MKKNYLIGIIAVVSIVVLVGVCFFTPIGKKLTGTTTITETTKEDSLNYVFVPDLISLHDADSNQFKNQYGGQTIETTIRFKRYDIIPKTNTQQGQYGRYVAKFSYGENSRRSYTGNEVVCYFNGEDAAAFAKLKKGDIVTISGTCLEEKNYLYWDLEMKNCKVIKVHSTQGSDPNMLMYRIAADRGNTTAMLMLGNLYYKGKGVPVNMQTAAKWYRAAGELGEASALNNLGVMYRYGDGVEKNFEKAFKLLTLAADRGNSKAMRNIGECYENGAFVAKDYNKAREWYQKSFEAGNESAEKDLQRVLGK